MTHLFWMIRGTTGHVFGPWATLSEAASVRRKGDKVVSVEVADWTAQLANPSEEKP